VQGVSIRRAEPNARLDACRRVGLRANEGDRRAASNWHDFDPARTTAEANVERLR